MPVYVKDNFRVELGVVMLAGELGSADRQCAWELYCELVSRTALIGRENADGEQVFDGEVLFDSLESLREFVVQARALMRSYPVGAIPVGSQPRHLGFFIASLLEILIRPFLDKWWSPYRYWWTQVAVDLERAALPPFTRQTHPKRGFPEYQELVQDWIELRVFCRAVLHELTTTFDLPCVLALEPPGLKGKWVKEIKQINIRARTW